MRTLRLLVVLGLMALWLHDVGQDSPVLLAPLDTEVCHEPSASPLAICDNCQREIESPEPATDAMSSEDRRTLARISQSGRSLIDRRAVTDMSILLKQLQTERCSLELPALSDAVLEPPQLYNQARESVVVVAGLYLCGKCDKWHASTATGFVISTSGAIVTNYHVVDSTQKETLVVMTADGHVQPVKRVLAADQRDDLAILQVDADNLTPLPIATNHEAAPVGSSICVISHPANHFYSLTAGVVSRYFSHHTAQGDAACIDITADYARGSSGAPVLNMQGQVVGIVRSTESIYYAKKDGQPSNLQMVFKHCIPVECLQQLIN